jgi:DNA-binding NarL/FixJ family response regulator
MIRVVVAEDHHLVREGICKLLDAAGEVQIVGEADNGTDALELARVLQPDVLVLDISMPKLDGLDALKELRRIDPSTQVVMLSMHSDASLVRRALEEGALGFVLKQSVSEELHAAIQAASRGCMYLSPEVSEIVRSRVLAKRPSEPLDRLSPRETEVVRLIVEGKSTKEIADRLHTSVKTVEKQRRDAMRKLDVDNVASLVRVSLELGLSTAPKERA